MISRYYTKPFDRHSKPCKSSNMSMVSESSFSRLSANNSFIRSKSIRKKLDNLISRCQSRSKSFNKYKDATKINIAIQTITERNVGGLSEYTKDAGFIRFLKAISVYCQNDDFYKEGEYKNIHRRLLPIKKLFNRYKGQDKSKDSIRIIEEHKKMVSEGLASSPECSSSGDSVEEEHSTGTVSYINNVYNKLFTH